MAKTVSILYCYINKENGYGKSAQSMIDMFKRVEGVELDLLPLDNPNIFQEKKLKDHYDIMISHISINNVINDFMSGGNLSLTMTRCDKVYQYMLWETDRLPSPVKNFLEKEKIFDGFICPSRFVEGLVEKYGETYYIPITAEDVDYDPTMRRRNDRFTVLTVAQYSVRKAIDVSVVAFATAFNRVDDVQFVIKIGEKLMNIDVKQLVHGNIVRSMVDKAPKIYTIEEHLPEEELRKLYLNADCYLHLSRGEGFGMTPLTAISYGLPTIYTKWSAHAEFLSKDKNSKAVDGRLDLCHSMDRKFGFEPEMLWYEADLKDAVEKLRLTYRDWKANKIKYKVPEVVNEYKEDYVLRNQIGDFLGFDVQLKEDKKIGEMNVLEY